jgi:tetratricopeptide (TPR) repeat protein
MERMSTKFLTYVAIALCAMLLSCSTSPSDKSASQLVQEGWQAYAAKNFPAALSNFDEAIAKDGNLTDAYNGAGWTNAKLGNLSTSVSRFTTGLQKDAGSLEIKAGLSFVFNAIGDYVQSLTMAQAVITANANWSFSRDGTVSVADLRLVMAAGYFAQGEYSLSLQQVQLLNASFQADITTIPGQAALAQEIERLRSIV